MPHDPAIHSVYRAMNRPLTIWGAERRLFFLALAVSGATFNFFGSLIGGLLMFALLFLGARATTVTDPHLLRILLNSAGVKRYYDPTKLEYFRERLPHA